MPEPRGTRRTYPRNFLLSGFAEEAKTTLISMITSMGGKCLESQMYLPESTHLISAKPMRSEKYLCACASGKWILTANYITDSQRAGKWLQEGLYEWSNYPGKKYPDGLVSAPKRWRNHVTTTGLRAFHDWTVLVLVEDKLRRPAVYKRVIESGGGHTLPINGPPLQDPLLFVDCVTHVIADQCYAAEIVAFHKARIPCLVPEYLAEYLFSLDGKMDPHRIDFSQLVSSSISHRVKVSPIVLTAIPEPKIEKPMTESINNEPLLSSSRIKARKEKQAKIARSAQSKSESENTKAEPSTPKVPRELKRKLKILQGIDGALQAKRFKKSHCSVIVPPWIKSSYKTFKSRDFPTAVSFPVETVNIIEADIEEKEWLSALTTIQSFLSIKQYPPPKLINMIIQQMLESECPKFVAAALNVLQSILCMHSPLQNPAMTNVYLEAMVWHTQETDESKKKRTVYWDFLSHVITLAIRSTPNSSHEAEESSPNEEEKTTAQENALALLRFLVFLIEEDFEAWKQRLELNLKKSSCMLDAIFWPGGRGFILRGATYPIKQLMKKMAKVTKNLSITSKFEVQRSRLLLSLVQMVSSRLLIMKTKSKVPWEIDLESSLLGDMINVMVTSIMEADIPNSFDKLRFLLSSLQPVWLRLKVTEALLERSYTSILEEQQVSLYKSESLSLKKIVEYYFTFVPQSAIIKQPPMSPTPLSRTATKTSTSSVKPLGNSTKGNGDATMVATMAKANKRNVRGETPLHVACIKNQVDRVRELLAVPGINVNASDHAGWTALHEAANHGHVGCVREILNFKPNPHAATLKSDLFVNLLAAPSACGTTPLHDAVINGHIEVVKLIVAKGGKSVLNAKNASGQTPFDLAMLDSMKDALTIDPSIASSSSETSPSQDKENNNLKKDINNNIPEKRYIEILGPSTAPRSIISGSNCERLCILTSYLLKSYTSFYEIPQLRTEVMKIMKETSSANMLTSTPCIPPHSLSTPLQSDALLAPATARTGLKLKGEKAKDDLFSNISKNRICEDLETFRRLQVYTKQFTKHVGRISPSGIQENSNCKGILRHMRALTS